jgi:spermidine/putrescine transport system permease protein
MTQPFATRLAISLYMALFFGFLLGPLLIMAISAFNTPSYPQVWPIEGFTFDWFIELANDREMLQGLRTSVVIGIWVVVLSVPLGLAGAIVMTQVFRTAKSFYYFVVVAPVLTPGIVIGIATVVFWRDFSGWVGLRSLIYSGGVLTVLAQSSFIASYCMLIIMARLQRFDTVLEEAALDLGASYPQIFRDVLLPFLKPALASSAMLAFLSSFENYNATTFAILSDKTLTTVLAARVRLGSSPSISALATVIVLATIIAAIVFEIIKRRKDRQRELRQKNAWEADASELATQV